MKNSILFLFLIIYVNCIKQIFPQNTKFTPEDFQKMSNYFQILNSLNQMNPAVSSGLNSLNNNAMNFNPLLMMQMLGNTNQLSNINNLNGISNLISNRVNSVNPIDSTNIFNMMNLIPQSVPIAKNTLDTKVNNLRTITNITMTPNVTKETSKEIQVSEILKDEIDQLKQLTKDANNVLRGKVEKEENLVPIKEINNKKPDMNNNGPIQNSDLEDLGFLETKNKRVSKNESESLVKNINNSKLINLSNTPTDSGEKSKISNLRKTYQIQDEEIKQEFEEKLGYLLNKLDVLYRIVENK